MFQNTIHSIQSTNMSSSKGQKHYKEFTKSVRSTYPRLEKAKQYKNREELWWKVNGDSVEFNKISSELKATATAVSSASIKFWTRTVSSPPQRKKLPTLDITTACVNPVTNEDADLVSQNSNNGR